MSFFQALYAQQKSIEDGILTADGETWSDVCVKLPVVKAPDISKILFGSKRRRRRRRKRNAIHPELMHVADTEVIVKRELLISASI